MSADAAELIDPTCDVRWDAFIQRPRIAPSHAYNLAAWGAIWKRAYGADSLYLAVEDGHSEIIAALPLSCERGLRRGGRLSSIMLGLRGGPTGEDEHSRQAVTEAACRLAANRAATRLLLTTETAGLDQLVPDLRLLGDTSTWVTALPGDPDELRRQWSRDSKNLARNLSKAERSGVVVREARAARDVWRFYILYARTMRGHRVFPRSWLEIYLAHKLLQPAGQCNVYLAEHAGRAIAGAMFLTAGDTLALHYAGSDPGMLGLRPNHAVYLHAIERGIARGSGRLDWGQAPPASSLGRFKRQWSTEELPVFSYSYEPTRAKPPNNGDLGVADRPVDYMGHAVTGDSLAARMFDRVSPAALGFAATVAHRIL